MDDVQQMIVNEVNRLERAIDKRAKALAQLEAKTQKRTSPKRYVLEFIVPADTRFLSQPFTRSFVVDKDCQRFICQSIVASVAVVGQVSGFGATSQGSNKLTLPPESTNALDFLWRIRDTSTDREWQNQPLPRYFLASGLTSAFDLPWSAPVRPGAEIETTIVPTVIGSNPTFSISDVVSYTVQISFFGFEVL